MRVLIVYDCLFPWTVGGAERWYRNLAERLAGQGHEVTYLTMRQWDRGAPPEIPGVRVSPAGPRMALYAGAGRRRILPPLVFGWGVLRHLLRRGRSYDVVHTASFPYFSLLAAALLRPLGGYRLVVDWHEVWSRAYWREYLGGARGDVGWAVQRLCARMPQRAFCFSRLYAERLRGEGLRGEVTILPGEYEGPMQARLAPAPEPLVLFAGRHIPEKRVPAVVGAVAEARAGIAGLRAVILGDGPERPAVLRAVARHDLAALIEMPGFVAASRVEELMGRALCLLLPSSREGYGMVVIEAASRGTPSIVVAGPDNAAVELVSEGENGFVAPSHAPADLAAAIRRVAEGGEGLRRTTAAWFDRNAQRLSLAGSLEAVAAAYTVAERAAPEPRPGA